MRQVKVIGLRNPIRVTTGKGDHAELALISPATHLLLMKGADVQTSWAFCEQCGGYHMTEGLSVEDTSHKVGESVQSGEASGKTAKVSYPRRL